jgi:hypothetical protein
MDIFQVDELSLYLGNDIKVADGVVIKVPQIGQIASYGESAYFATMQTLCATPSSMKAQLDDWKLDWMKVTDFQLFGMLCTALKPEQTSLVLGDLDLSELKPRPINESGEIVLSNKDGTIIIKTPCYDALVENYEAEENKPVIEKLQSDLKKWYKKQASAYITKRVEYYKDIIGVTVTDVSIKSRKSQWGSCDSNGCLTFSWRLVMACPDAIDYVVIHELAHIKHHNHSKEFYSFIEMFLPDYKNIIKPNREVGM